MRRCVLVLAAFALVAVCGAGAAGKPVTFAWPTSVETEPDGSLLVVENGLKRLVRVDPAGHVTQVASLGKPYAVARSATGAIFVTDAGALKRIDGAGAPRTVATLPEEVGPIALAANGDVYLATASRIYRLPRGATRPVVLAGAGFSGPHGIAVARNGVVLVSDTGNNRIVRVDAKTGAAATLARASNPRGLDVAADGTIYVVEAGPKRVARFSPGGKRLGFLGPPFGDPYDLDVAPAGVYVVDTSASGTIVRIARSGAATAVSAA